MALPLITHLGVGRLALGVGDDQLRDRLPKVGTGLAAFLAERRSSMGSDALADQRPGLRLPFERASLRPTSGYEPRPLSRRTTFIW